MTDSMYFEQCMDFLARMIEKYGDNIKMPVKDTEDDEDIKDTAADQTNAA